MLALAGPERRGEALADRLVTGGCLPRVYAAVERLKASGAVAVACCQVLAALAVKSAGTRSRSLVTTAVAPSGLCSIMEAHLYSALCKRLPSPPCLAPRAVGNACLERVDAAMEAHKRVVGVQEAAVAVLRNVSTDTPKDKLLSSGGLARVFDAMEEHVYEAKLQQLGCTFIHFLTTVCTRELKERVFRAGALDRLYAAMEAHPGAMEVQKESCDAIVNFLAIPDVQADIADDVCTEPLLQAAKTAHRAHVRYLVDRITRQLGL